ncbi:MAG: hypothetical protein ABI759_02945 [Candidatus Solibacter sp.]
MRKLYLALLPLGLLAQSKTVVENTRVRIVSALDRPHQKSAPHKHDPNRVMIYLDNGDQDITNEGQETQHHHWKTGDVAWSLGGPTHTSEVVSSGDLRIIEVEIKQPGPAKPPQRKRSLDPLSIDSSHCKLIFENSQVRVYRATLPSGMREKWHEHAGAGRAVVLLSDVSARLESDNGQFSTLNGGPGDAFWNDGYIKHRGSNIGSQAAEMIVVEVK